MLFPWRMTGGRAVRSVLMATAVLVSACSGASNGPAEPSGLSSPTGGVVSTAGGPAGAVGSAPDTSSGPASGEASTTTAEADTVPGSSTTVGTGAPSVGGDGTTAPVSTTLAPNVPGSEVGQTALVVSVVDGDTLRVRFDDGTEEKVRLIGMDAPEVGECYHDRAAAALRNLVGDRLVTMVPDQSDRDRYGRLLRYVFVGEDPPVFVNGALVEGGYAVSRRYDPDTSRQAELEEAQQRARDRSAGLWAPDACGAPVSDPSAGGEPRIERVIYDAPGNDNLNLNGEWVEIAAGGPESVDLTGWVLKDASASHRYRFPPGFTIGAGETIRVYTGCGTDTAVELYWCNQGSAVWNNSGDTAFLLDPAGNIVDSVTW